MKDIRYFKELISSILPEHQKDLKPHKALLLLAVIDGIDMGRFEENRFEFGATIKDLFSKRFQEFARPQDSNRPHNPFFHLKSSGFWRLIPKKGMEEALAGISTIGGSGDIVHLVEYACMDEDLYCFLGEGGNRQELSRYITNHLKSASKPEEVAIDDNSELTASNKDTSNGYPTATTTTSKKTVHALPSSTLVKSQNQNFSSYSDGIPALPHEFQAIKAITDVLGKYIQFISNYFVYDPATNQYHECDLVAVCQERLAIIELKHWAGEIEVYPHSWVINRRFHRPDPHRSNSFKCKLLKSFYLKSFPALPELWVESIVVLTNEEAIIHNAHSHKTDMNNPTFAGVDVLIKHFNHRIGALSQIPEAKKLKAPQVNQVADILRNQIKPAPKQRLNIPGFEIVEDLTHTREKLEFLIRPLEKKLHTIKRARVFCVDLTASAEARKQERIKALNNLGALEQISDHPNILKVWQIPNDDGLVIEASDWSQEGTLADAIRQKKTFSTEEAYTITKGILHGLSAIHRESVIHRDLNPGNILISKGIPKLMNFDLSYYLEEDRVTVIPETAVLKLSPYMAPEIFRRNSPTEAADLFSVGVILYEMLAGELPFKSSLDLEKHQGVLSQSVLAKLQERDIPELVQALLYELIQLDPAHRPKDAGAVLKDLEQVTSDAQVVAVQPDRVLEPGEFHSAYEIEDLLGKGREAQVYKAKQEISQSVALKIFNHDIERERIYSEKASIKRVKSPYVVRCWDTPVLSWSDKRLFLTLDLVRGKLLRDLIEEETLPSIEEFKHVTRCLLEALDCMHNDPNYTEPLLHNDIKPENIILNEQNDPVLIDFGTASTPEVGPYMGTPGYVAPDLIQGVDLDYRKSGDLFALAITLFEWFCGQHPYDEIPTVTSVPKTPLNLRADISSKLNDWLYRAIQPIEDNRFCSVREMRQSFEGVFALPIEPHVTKQELEKVTLPSMRVDVKEFGNEFVEYLNTLHNVTAENENALAEAQALSPFFGSIHVSLEVTDIIEKYLTTSGKGHVILTGHAGDGKSTIGLELFKRFKGISMTTPLTTPLQEWEKITLANGVNIHMVKDMSELPEGERVERLRGACQADSTTDRWFMISNTGTFLTSLKRLAQQEGLNWLELEDEALNLLERNDPEELNCLSVPILIINLARIDNLKTARQLLAKIVADSHWAQCGDCDLDKLCPININITALKENLDRVAERIEWVYRRLYEYGSRLTMRQIAGHLAYALTSGLDCRRIRTQAGQPIPPDVTDFLFFNRFFGFAGPNVDQDSKRLTAIEYLLPLELGTKPYPSLDRRLWTDEKGEIPKVASYLEPIFSALRQTVRYNTPSDDIPAGRLRQEVRRIVYLFGDIPKDLDGFLSSFLESQMLIQMESWQAAGKIPGLMEANDLTKRVLHVLQEQFTGMALSEQSKQSDLYITLKRSDGELRQSVQILLAQIPQTYFYLSMKPVSETMQCHRYILMLVDKISGERLPLELPFLDFVIMRGMGEIGQKLDPGYTDRLERFKVGLLKFRSYCQFDGLPVLEFTNKGTFNIRKLLIGEKVQVL